MEDSERETEAGTEVSKRTQEMGVSLCMRSMWHGLF
jgi:hypothetical protein